MVDAPVSGGIAAAEGGTLTFMVGGSAEAFGAAEPFLTQMGKAVIHAGGAGAGQAAKICNNMLLGASMIATCETFVLPRSWARPADLLRHRVQGVRPMLVDDQLLPGARRRARRPRPTANYDGGFAAALMLKDLRLAMEAAAGADAYTPMGAHAEELYTRFAERLGGAGKDFSGIIQMIDDSWVSPAGSGGGAPQVGAKFGA
jgi:3-hydroxyisobutyrate dehydrogenase